MPTQYLGLSGALLSASHTDPSALFTYSPALKGWNICASSARWGTIGAMTLRRASSSRYWTVCPDRLSWDVERLQYNLFTKKNLSSYHLQNLTIKCPDLFLSFILLFLSPCEIMKTYYFSKCKRIYTRLDVYSFNFFLYFCKLIIYCKNLPQKKCTRNPQDFWLTKYRMWLG